MSSFRTNIEIGTLPRPQTITYQHKILTIGSCFAENIGGRLANLHFRQCLNPFGVSYNPASIAQNLRRLSENRIFEPSELFEENDLFQSFAHHSSFGAASSREALQKINAAYGDGASYYADADYWIITLGTAWIYRLIENQQIVNNCHRQKANIFERSRLSVAQIVDNLYPIFADTPSRQIILTVSPVRHLKDTLHGNQISKSLLLLACEALCELLPEQVFYFPAYEIMMDDLRDYRFYADDMQHPSAMAVDYIWSFFETHYLAEAEKPLRRQIADLQKAATHRPFNLETRAHQQFLQTQVEKIAKLKKDLPKLNFDALLHIFQQQMI